MLDNDDKHSGPGARIDVRVADVRLKTDAVTGLQVIIATGHPNFKRTLHIRVPFTMQEDNIPLIQAVVDGVPGSFQFDVRAPGTLFFVRAVLGTKRPRASLPDRL